jgi:hypothetical protein
LVRRPLFKCLLERGGEAATTLGEAERALGEAATTLLHSRSAVLTEVLIKVPVSYDVWYTDRKVS